MTDVLLLSYFTAASEALHFASSTDGIAWTPLGGGRPVLHSRVGSKVIRDPFIARGADGRFHLLATNGWNSTSIVHTASDDLVDWDAQTLIPVMTGIPFAQNSWAPEFFIDRTTGLHHVIWSSSIHPNSEQWQDSAQDSTMEHRIWGATTSDFVTWSDSSLFFDPGYTVIDASVLPLGDRYLMAFKDERGDNQTRQGVKGLRTVTFDRPGQSFSPQSEVITSQPAEGPTLFHAEGRLMVMFDLFLDGAYAALRSGEDGQWTPVDDFQGPPGARHGAVLTVTPAELLRLENGIAARSGETTSLAPPE
jgi:hypothetical protein